MYQIEIFKKWNLNETKLVISPNPQPAPEKFASTKIQES